ncbi:MAG: DUF814 domain-containing protein [Deltaproteobacteria bacterium]|nr:DUF814 domain-containing protein [Deltaproteobacteria bacterium]
MSLNRAELAGIVAELATTIPGQRLRRISAPDPQSCQLIFRRSTLFLCFRPGAARLHFLAHKLAVPAQPPAWIMKLRRELEGGICTSVQQLAGDRIIELRFDRRERQEARLVAELFGRGRCLLVIGERIAFAASGRDQPLVGQAYGPPARRPESGREPESRFGDPDPTSGRLNRIVAEHYSRQAQAGEIEGRRREALRSLDRSRKRLLRRIEHLERDRDQTLQAERLRHHAELVKLHLHSLRKGQAEVELAEPADPEAAPVRLSLDPSLGPVENMQRMFARARRLTSARGPIGQRLFSSREELDELESLERELRSAGSLDALDALQARIARRARKPPSGRRGARRLPYRSYRSASGKTILVGRSGSDNHQLTFRIARGSDLWLHARDSAGAHVVIRLERGEEVDEQTLIDAATLAARASPQKDAAKVEVTYTRVKHVHPLKGAAPGTVSISRARTLLVRIEPDRLARLDRGPD